MALSLFIAALGGELQLPKLIACCITGIIGNRSDRALDFAAKLTDRGIPQNLDVLKALHRAFVRSLQATVAACEDGAAQEARDLVVLAALRRFSIARELTALDLDRIAIPQGILEECVRAIYGHAAEGAGHAATEAIVATIEETMQEAMTAPIRDVFHNGWKNVPSWASAFELFFAREVKQNTPVFRILLFDRANELAAAAERQAHMLAELYELVLKGISVIEKHVSGEADATRRHVETDGDRTRQEFAELRRTVQSEKYQLVIDELHAGREPPGMRDKLTGALNISAPGASHAQVARQVETVTQVAERAAQSEDPRLQDVAALLAAGRFAEAAALRLEVAQDVDRMAAEGWRDTASLLSLTSLAGAISAMTRATELDPGHFWSWIELCLLQQLRGNLAAARLAAEQAIQRARDKRDAMVATATLGDIYLIHGDLQHARLSFAASVESAEDRAALEPGNSQRQRDLAVGYDRLGYVEMSAGNLAGARARYEAGLAITERLVALEPGISELQRDLTVAYDRLGDVEVAAGNLAEARERFESGLSIRVGLAALEPRNSERQRDLTISYDKLGDVEISTGNLVGARAQFEAGLAIRERLAALEPENSQWQRDLTLSYDRIGDVEVSASNLAGARLCYEAGLAIRERLVALEPGNSEWQRDLTISYDKLGEMELLARNLAGARARFDASLAIRERLVALEPGNSEWQRDVSISYDRLGELEMSAGNLAGARVQFEAGLAIVERLAAMEPENNQWQRDLSISYIKLGHVEALTGDLAKARVWFEAGLAIAERLAAHEPGNSQWQRDLTISYIKFGELEMSAGNRTEARAQFEAGLGSAERLAALEPGNGEWQRDLAVSYDKQSKVAEHEDDIGLAIDWSRKAELVRSRLVELWPDHPVFANDLAWVRGEIARLEAMG